MLIQKICCRLKNVIPPKEPLQISGYQALKDLDLKAELCQDKSQKHCTPLHLAFSSSLLFPYGGGLCIRYSIHLECCNWTSSRHLWFFSDLPCNVSRKKAPKKSTSLTMQHIFIKNKESTVKNKVWQRNNMLTISGFVFCSVFLDGFGSTSSYGSLLSLSSNGWVPTDPSLRSAPSPGRMRSNVLDPGYLRLSFGCCFSLDGNFRGVWEIEPCCLLEMLFALLALINRQCIQFKIGMNKQTSRW